MSDGNITRSSKRNKKYRPKFAQVVPKLPSIESFQLETILNDTLKAESQQVVNHLLDVTTNYQNDLRNEIKHKLSIEQKIQYKNIQIVKLCNSLIRVLAHRRKKLHKCAIPDSVPYINQLLISCVDVSDRIKLLTTKLSRIDGDNKLDGGKYPNLYKLMHPNEINIEVERRDDVERREDVDRGDINKEINKVIKRGEEPLTGGETFQHIDQQILTKNLLKDQENTTKNKTDPNSNSRINMNTEPSPCDPKSLPNTPNNSNENGDIPHIKTDQEIEAIDPKHIQDQDIEIDIMDPEGFELFISSSIGKYRSLQSKKYESSDPFRHTNSDFQTLDPHNDLISDDPSLNSNQSDSKKTFHIMNNPINLLHSSLISNPNYTNILPINENSHPFANLISVKSPATIKLTLQTSHFKKLRINGSPITSESLRKANNRCQCTDTKPGDKDEIRTNETKKDDTKSDDTKKDPTITKINESPTKKDSTITNLNESPVSPARKLLTDSLLAIDSLRLSDDDGWNSSGLNTETDEDLESDPELSSNSSDSSLNSEQSASVAHTNQYYTSLQTELKHKKKLLKQSILRRRRRHFRKNIQRDELSPTPKHEPSHHTLKPKGSILKTNLANYRKTKKAVSMNFDNKYSEERSGISALNNAYDSTAKHEVSGMNVEGTIIQMEPDVEGGQDSEVIPCNGKLYQYPETSDVHNIRSISKLKEYIV